VVGHRDRALEEVRQSPDVARPGVGHEPPHGRRGHPDDGPGVALARAPPGTDRRAARCPRAAREAGGPRCG
jgi:hypothetical protein